MEVVGFAERLVTIDIRITGEGRSTRGRCTGRSRSGSPSERRRRRPTCWCSAGGPRCARMASASSHSRSGSGRMVRWQTGGPRSATSPRQSRHRGSARGCASVPFARSATSAPRSSPRLSPDSGMSGPGRDAMRSLFTRLPSRKNRPPSHSVTVGRGLGVGHPSSLQVEWAKAKRRTWVTSDHVVGVPCQGLPVQVGEDLLGASSHTANRWRWGWRSPPPGALRTRTVRRPRTASSHRASWLLPSRWRRSRP